MSGVTPRTRTSLPRWESGLDDCLAGVAWTSTGDRLAALTVGGQLVVFTTWGERVWQSEAHPGGALSLSLSPCGGWLATGGCDGRVSVWEVRTGVQRAQFRSGNGWVERLAWCPRGDLLAVAVGRRLTGWNVDGELQGECSDHESTLTGLVWRADGRFLATACYGKVRLFPRCEWQPRGVLEWRSSLISLAWSPDGKYLCAGTQEATVHLWPLPFRLRSDLEMSGYPYKVRELSWNRHGRLLATGGSNVATVWDCSGRGPAGRRPLRLEGHEARLSCLSFSPQDDLLVTADLAGGMLVWRPRRGSPQPLWRAQVSGGVAELAWSPTGREIALGSRDGTVCVWSVDP